MTSNSTKASTAESGGEIAPVKHTPLENVLAFAVGTFIASLGLYLLSSAGAVTGGTAGLSLLLSSVLGTEFGVTMFVVSAPFYILAVWKRGWTFALGTFLATTAVSALAYLHPIMFGELTLPLVYGTLAGDTLVGLGLLVLFRHNASLGGFSIVAFIAQDQLGWRAGWVQFVLDATVIVAAAFLIDPLTALVSGVGAFVLSVIITMNHKPGRYLGY